MVQVQDGAMTIIISRRRHAAPTDEYAKAQSDGIWSRKLGMS